MACATGGFSLPAGLLSGRGGIGPRRPWWWRRIISGEPRSRREFGRLNKARLIDEIQGLERRLALLQGSPAGGGDADPGAYLQAMVENLPGMVYRRVLHADGRITYPFVSGGITDILGFNDADRLAETVHPDDMAQRREAIAQSARTLARYDIEYRRLTASGETRWMRSIAQPRKATDGSIVWDGVMLDIERRKAAEETLRESEARHRMLFENSPTGIWEEDFSGVRAIIDELGREGVTDFRSYFREHPDRLEEAARAIKVINVNQAGLEQYGLKTKEQYLDYDARFEDWFDDAWKELYADQFATFAAGAPVHTAGYAERRADGSPFRAWSVTRVLSGHEDDWGCVVTNVQDITDIKKAEETLRFTQFTVDRAGDAIYWIGRDSRLLYANETASRMLGYTRDELLERRIVDIDPEVTAENWARAWQRIKHRSPYTFEAEHIAKSGQRIPIDVSVFFVRYGDREIACSVCRDITERKRAEAALARAHGELEERIVERTLELGESESRFRAVVENLPHAIYLKDVEGRYLLINRRCTEWYGPTREDAIGKTHAELYPQEIEAGLTHDLRDEEVMRTGRIVEWETEFLHVDGTMHSTWAIKIPIFDENGDLVAICGINTDVTEHRLLEEQLRQSQKMEAVGKLTGGIAHDFNNLLLAVTLNLELLKDRIDDEALAEEYIDSSLVAVDKGAELTRRLLAFARKQPLRPASVNVVNLANGMTGLLSRTLGRDIKIRTSLAPDLWPAMADATQIESAILNLAINARDAMPNGGTLELGASNASLDGEGAAGAPRVSPGDYIVLAVRDSGSGMAPEVLEQAFDPFFTTKGIGEGTGLGLSMVYGFVKQSGGDATIESEPGKGTCVTLYLPRAVESHERLARNQS